MTDETRRKISKAVKVSLIIANLVLVANGVYHWWHGRSSRADVYQDTVRTVERIQAEHKSATSEIESAGISINNAEGYIERAADAIGRSEDAATRSAAGIDNIQSLVNECKGIVEAQRRIIQDVDRANGVGAPEGEES